MDINMIKEFITLGMEIPKPKKTTTVIKVDNDSFKYRIGESNYKKVRFDDICKAIEEIKNNKIISRKWFELRFGDRAKSNPCNYTTIGGVLVRIGIAEYDSINKIYKLIQ